MTVLEVQRKKWKTTILTSVALCYLLNRHCLNYFHRHLSPMKSKKVSYQTVAS